MITTPNLPSLFAPVLEDKGQKARYGVSYIRNLCAQAGLGFNETSTDEDALAVDGDVKFRAAAVGVQVKCSSQFKIKGKSASWELEDHWFDKWHESSVPVYFVLVIVPSDCLEWLTHSDDGTMHRTAAYWVRVDTMDRPDNGRLSIPKSQRLDVQSFQAWHSDLMSAFTSPGGGFTSET